jgi:tyrosinase
LIKVPTFPTWHRPFVTLYEQTLAQQFPRIISWYTGQFKADLQAAADLWRLPYWEWATDKPTIPEAFCTPTLNIIRPASNKAGYERDPKPMDPNPLAAYKFHPIDDSFRGNFAIWPITLRCPDSDKPNAHSQPELVNNNLQDKKIDIKTKTWELFRTSKWTTFSNESTKTADSRGPMTSLESIHNHLHLCTGGTEKNKYRGHMVSLAVAAFDPIFWLHHCQVERLLTLWQTIHYTSPVPDTKDQLGNIQWV